jgi:hypothetical protein
MYVFKGTKKRTLKEERPSSYIMEQLDKKLHDNVFPVLELICCHTLIITVFYSLESFHIIAWICSILQTCVKLRSQRSLILALAIILKLAPMSLSTKTGGKVRVKSQALIAVLLQINITSTATPRHITYHRRKALPFYCLISSCFCTSLAAARKCVDQFRIWSSLNVRFICTRLFLRKIMYLCI